MEIGFDEFARRKVMCPAVLAGPDQRLAYLKPSSSVREVDLARWLSAHFVAEFAFTRNNARNARNRCNRSSRILRTIPIRSSDYLGHQVHSCSTFFWSKRFAT